VGKAFTAAISGGRENAETATRGKKKKNTPDAPCPDQRGKERSRKRKKTEKVLVIQERGKKGREP